MALESQRLYDTSQGGDELITALHPVVKPDAQNKTRKTNTNGQNAAEMNIVKRLAKQTVGVRN